MSAQLLSDLIGNRLHLFIFGFRQIGMERVNKKLLFFKLLFRPGLAKRTRYYISLIR